MESETAAIERNVRRRYAGEINEEGRPHGQGVMTHADGRRYEGEWCNGKPHGQGVMTYTGRRDEGEWRYEGEWRDGEPQGNFRLVHNEGMPVSGTGTD